MKKTIILALTLLLLIGCRHNRAVSPRLVELDSLIAVAPDSAAALLEAIPSDSLTTPENLAYHALLLTQAKYKAYLPFGEGALDTINMAARYYNDGHNLEKNTRSILYKGCVFEDQQRLDSAIYYYKAAEDLAIQSGDTYHRGYALLRMASLFQSKYALKEAINCFRSSLSCAQAIRNDYDALYALQELANLYQTIKIDSAFFFSERAIDLSLQMDSAEYDYCLSTLASCYLIKQQYRQCIDNARQAISMASNRESVFRSCHWAAQAYAHLSMVDSGAYYFQLAPPPLDKADSVLFLTTKSYIDRDSVIIQNQFGNMADTLVCFEDIVALDHVLKSYENERKQKVKIQNERKLFLWLSLSALLLTIAGVTTYLRKRQKEKSQAHAIAQQHDEILILKQELEKEIISNQQLRDELKKNEKSCQSLNNEIGRLSQIIVSKDETARAQDELKRQYRYGIVALKADLERKQAFMSELQKQFVKHQGTLRSIVARQKLLIMACYHDGEQQSGHNLQKLHSYMVKFFTDDYCNTLIASIRALYPKLDNIASERELDMKEMMTVCMHLAGYQNKIIREYLQVDRDHTVTNIKKSLAEKLLGKGSSLDDFKTTI